MLTTHERIQQAQARVRRDFAAAMAEHGETPETLAERCGGFTPDDIRRFLKGENVTSTVLTAAGTALGVEYRTGDIEAQDGMHCKLMVLTEALDEMAQGTNAGTLFSEEGRKSLMQKAADLFEHVELMHAYNQHLGNRIRARMDELGVTVEDVADALGESPEDVALWLPGGCFRVGNQLSPLSKLLQWSQAETLGIRDDGDEGAA